MPTYEFRCPTGHDFEKFYRSIASAPSDVHCPTCGKVATRQMSAGGGLVFKGSGFYITDYGKDGKKSQTPPVKAAEGSSETTAGDSTAAKSESSASGEGSKTTGAGKSAGESKPVSESKPATPAPAKKQKKNE
jgi:putative FmdB family regulatory protein